MATAIGFLSNLDPESEVLSDGTVRLADGSILRPPKEVQSELRMQASRAAQIKKANPPQQPRLPTSEEAVNLLSFAPGPVGLAAEVELLRRDEDVTPLDVGLAGFSILPGGKILTDLLKRGKGGKKGEIVEDIVMEGDEITTSRRIGRSEDIVLESSVNPLIPNRQEVIDTLVDDGLEVKKAERLADGLLQLSRAGFETATEEVLEALSKGADADEIVNLINKSLGKVQ